MSDEETSIPEGSPPPIHFQLHLDKKLFEVTQNKGKTLSNGGFGVVLTTTTDSADVAPSIGSSKGTDTIDLETGPTQLHPFKVSKEFVFLEDVIYLHERGLAQVLDEKGQSMQKMDLYSLLEPFGLSLYVYLVYTHLRSQTFRVVRSSRDRRRILAEMEDLLSDSDTNPSTVKRRDIFQQLRMQLRKVSVTTPPPQISTSGHATFAFDVYEPGERFTRSTPGLPDFHVAITYFHEKQLNFPTMRQLLSECGGRRFKLATVADGGTVIMFGITDYGVPDRTTKK